MRIGLRLTTALLICALSSGAAKGKESSFSSFFDEIRNAPGGDAFFKRKDVGDFGPRLRSKPQIIMDIPGKSYDPGMPSLDGKRVRWRKESMPLKVWISPGLRLVRSSTKPDLPVAALAMNSVKSGALEKLPVVRGWSEKTKESVEAGINAWRRAELSGGIRYKLTSRPDEANILVFFYDKTNNPFPDDIEENTSSRGFTVADLKHPRFVPLPVVIELSAKLFAELARLKSATAHEFGHALGISGHSPHSADLMSVDHEMLAPSPNDLRTLFELYRSEPDFYFQ